jgi:hypothetical protein
MVGFTPEPSILHRTDLIDLTLHGPNVRMHQIYNLLVLVLLSLLVRRVRLGGNWEDLFVFLTRSFLARAEQLTVTDTLPIN